MVFSYFAVRLSSRPRNGPGRFEVFRALGKAGGCAAGSGVASVCGAVVRDVEVVVLEKTWEKRGGALGVSGLGCRTLYSFDGVGLSRKPRLR